jgi:nicotinamidase-related amidase
VIERRCEFRRDTTRRILDRALEEAVAAWGSVDRIDRIQMVYKFHLLDMRMAEWVREYAEERGLEIHICQPDTANRELARESWRGRVLVIGANEWSDIMHAELVVKYGHGAQEERFSRNLYLHDDLAGLTEYQTVHGSADDIAGRGVVNPLATLRAAADILERHAGIEGATARLERALAEARRAGRITPDMGGEASTDEVVAFALERYVQAGAPAGTARARSADALIAVDLQNDYCAEGGCFHALGLVDPAETRRVADAAGALIARARAAGVEVIFLRTVMGDGVPETVRRRNQAQGRGECVRPGTWGAEPFGPASRSGERVVVKSGYDGFLGTRLERELRMRGVERLFITGVFTDVCVDALARSAYQLGFEVVVVDDATLPLQQGQAESLAFMERFYGARVLDLRAATALLAGAPQPRGDEGRARRPRRAGATALAR